MKQGLPRELENHLKKKCLSLLSYYQPEWGTVSRRKFICSCKQKSSFPSTPFLRHSIVLPYSDLMTRMLFCYLENDSEGLKNTKLSHLSAQLDKDKKRSECLKETCRENTVLLQRQTQLYLSELIKCIQLLQSLILDHRLRIQTDLDGKKLEYLEGKCELVLQKIKTEIVDIQLETYTADSISAHRKIREKLVSELKACQVEKQSVEIKLSSFEILGKEFGHLAEEYCRLRHEIELKNWALKEFTQYNNK